VYRYNVAPRFVYAIVFCELGLFAGFGITQVRSSEPGK
jgi:hypothetical protein